MINDKKQLRDHRREILFSKGPFFTSILAVYLVALSQGDIVKNIGDAFGFSVVMGILSLNYFYLEKFFKKRYWIYFLIQGIILFDIAVIVKHDFEVVFIGLIPVLIFQSMIVYHERHKVISASIYYYILFCLAILKFGIATSIFHYLILLTIVVLGLRLYAMLYLREVELRVKSQNALIELEDAYDRIEELALINERQRLARDLHDTLSQGLVGVIMQLDAIQANLDRGRAVRAEEIIQSAMQQSRKILSETRLVINDLRTTMSENDDFKSHIDHEINIFKAASQISVEYNFTEPNIQIKDVRYQNTVLYLVREVLNNIIKHSKATHVKIDIDVKHSKLNIGITDNGIGFDVNNLSNLRGHFGILGMNERAKLLDGSCDIKSKRHEGTSVLIAIPMKGGNNES